METDNKTLEEFDTTKGIVMYLLRTEERCRNDDKYLTYRFLNTSVRRIIKKCLFLLTYGINSLLLKQ